MVSAVAIPEMLDPDSSPKPVHASSPARARASATGREAGCVASSAKWFAIACRLGSVVISSPLFKVDPVEYLGCKMLLPSTVHCKFFSEKGKTN
jgi:hypothetical protein